MKIIKLLFTLFCMPALLWAQLPYQQSFETTSGYTTSVPFGSDGSDFFQRFNSPNATNWTNSPITGYDGSWYIGAEDHDFTGGSSEITVTTNSINITGASNLEVSIKVGASGDNPPTDNRYEGSDYLYVEYQLNGAGVWTTLGIFKGGAGGGGSFFYHDVLRNGVTGTGDDVHMTKDMSDITYNINTIVGSTVTGTSLKIRARFSVAGPQEEIQIDDIRVTGTAASCSITDLAAGSATPCANNLYNRDVIVTYSNAPSNGSLIVDGQSFSITGSPQTVTLIDLPANGASANVTASFSADVACSYTETGLFTNPAPCVVCSIDGISAGTQLPCSITNNKYAQEVVVTYTFPPASGSLSVNGQLFPITGSPQTCLLTNLTSNGASVNVTAFFTANTGCTLTNTGTFTAPAACSCAIPAANLVSQSFEGPVDYAGYTTSIPFFNTGTDAFARGENADFSFDNGTPPTGVDGTKYIFYEDVPNEEWLKLDAVNISGWEDLRFSMQLAAPNSSGIRYEASDSIILEARIDGGSWIKLAKFAGNPNASINTRFFYRDVSLNGVTGSGDDIQMSPAMYDFTVNIDDVLGYGAQGSSLETRVRFSGSGSHDEIVFDNIRIDGRLCTPPPPPPCSITSIVAGTQSPCVNSLYNQDVTVTYANAPASGTLDINGQSFSITGSPQSVTLTNLTADGLAVDVTASFSDDAGCVLTETGLFAAPAACPAPPATGLSFDGVDDGVQLSAISTGNGLTIEAWIKPTLKTDFSTILANKLGGLSNNGFHFAINEFSTSNGKLVFETTNAATISNSGVTWGAWQHVAVTVNGSTVKMYVNGTELTTFGFNSGVALNPTTTPVLIGEIPSYFANSRYQGDMDELRIWNTARTAQQIMDKKDCELSGNEPGLIAYYNFNNGIVGANNAGLTTLADQTSNSNDGTLQNFALSGPTSNWVEGAAISGVCAPCPTTNTFTPMLSPNASYVAAGANVPNTYYWGISRGFIGANPTGGTAPYSYNWYSKEGYNVKNSTGQTARLMYPTGPTRMIVEITDATGCMVKDSVEIDWVDYTCGGIWDYELCDVNTGISSCVQTTATMRSMVATGNYTFGACQQQPLKKPLDNPNADLTVTVFPNPSNGTFTYTINNDESSSYEVMVSDLNGRTLYIQTIENNGNSYITQELNLGNLAAGVYLLTVKGEQTSSVERIVVQ